MVSGSRGTGRGRTGAVHSSSVLGPSPYFGTALRRFTAHRRNMILLLDYEYRNVATCMKNLIERGSKLAPPGGVRPAG